MDADRARQLRRFGKRPAADQVEGVASLEQRLARAGDVCGKREDGFFFFFSLSLPGSFSTVGKKEKNSDPEEKNQNSKKKSGPIQRRALRVQPALARVPSRRRAGSGGLAVDVRRRGAERREGGFGAFDESFFF